MDWIIPVIGKTAFGSVIREGYEILDSELPYWTTHVFPKGDPLEGTYNLPPIPSADLGQKYFLSGDWGVSETFSRTYLVLLFGANFIRQHEWHCPIYLYGDEGDLVLWRSGPSVPPYLTDHGRSVIIVPKDLRVQVWTIGSLDDGEADILVPRAVGDGELVVNAEGKRMTAYVVRKFRNLPGGRVEKLTP